MHGISVLGPRSLWDEYSLVLELHNVASYCTAQFEQIITLVAAITENARNFEDTLRAQRTTVFALGNSGNLREAMDRGLQVLNALDVRLPSNCP